MVGEPRTRSNDRNLGTMTERKPRTPAEAGSQVADPQTMSQEESAEGKPVAQQIDNFDDLNATQTGFNRWTVTNRSSKTAYQVRIGGEEGIECDCPDQKYNRSQDEFEACKHVLYVGYQSPRSMPSETWAIEQLSSLAMDLAGSTADARAAAEGMQEALVRAREGSVETPPADAQADATGGKSYDIDEVEERLHSALEKAGFEVQELDRGTYEGEDQLKFALRHDEFDELKRVTSECDLVGYDGELNAVDVSDVEEYIQVL